MITRFKRIIAGCQTCHAYLILIVFTSEVVLASILLAVVREEEHVLGHSLNVRIVLDEVVVL